METIEQQELKKIFEKLEAEGRIRDSGMRRNGMIVWRKVPDDEFTGKPWPRFICDNGNEV